MIGFVEIRCMRFLGLDLRFFTITSMHMPKSNYHPYNQQDIGAADSLWALSEKLTGATFNV